MFKTWEEQINYLNTVTAGTIKKVRKEIERQVKIEWLTSEDAFTLNDIFNDIAAKNIDGAEGTLAYVDTYLRDKTYDLIQAAK